MSPRGDQHMKDIGRLSRTRARDVWAHEAGDFTPWLLDNADALGEVLGMDLELSAAEHPVGQFSLDLIGLDSATGETVIMENQLEKSDHNHLGQILTYAGGTNATNIVWIADEIRSEHRAALDWLNERTDEKTRFFAVEISAARIGESAYAPLFEVVVKPNDWQKIVRASAGSNEQSQTREMYREFWSLFLQLLHAEYPGWTNTRVPQPQNWMVLPLGVSDVKLCVVGTREYLRVEIYFSGRSSEENDANFQAVLAHKTAIEGAFGDELLWDELEGRKACRVSYARHDGVGPDSNWDEQTRWLVNAAGRLKGAVDSVGGMPALLMENVSGPK